MVTSNRRKLQVPRREGLTGQTTAHHTDDAAELTSGGTPGVKAVPTGEQAGTPHAGRRSPSVEGAFQANGGEDCAELGEPWMARLPGLAAEIDRWRETPGTPWSNVDVDRSFPMVPLAKPSSRRK